MGTPALTPIFLGYTPDDALPEGRNVIVVLLGVDAQGTPINWTQQRIDLSSISTIRGFSGVKGVIISAPEGAVEFSVEVASTGQFLGNPAIAPSDVTEFLTYGSFKMYAKPSDTLIVTLLGNTSSNLPMMFMLTNFEVDSVTQYGGTD